MKKTKKGFIDLNANIPNWNKKRQKGEIIPSEGCGPYYQGWWIKNLDEEDWFLKVFNQKGIPYRFYVELLLEYLAQMVGIRTVESKIVEVNKQLKTYGLISKDYRKKDCIIISGKEIVLNFLKHLEKSNLLEDYLGIKKVNELENANSEYNSLDCIWDALNYRYANFSNGKEIVANNMNEPAKRYTFLFLMMQSDFHLGNWEMIEQEKTAFLVPMYDMDMSFRTSFNDYAKNNSMKSYLTSTQDVYQDFSSFYFSLPEKDQIIIQNEILVLTPETIATAIDLMPKIYSIEMPNSMKETILQRYNEHYQKIIDITQNKRTR